MEMVVLDAEFIRQKALEIGESEARFNPYAAILRIGKIFENEGLTPEYIMNPMGLMTVTSQEALHHKLH